MPPPPEPHSHRAPDNTSEQQKARDLIIQINVTLQAVSVGYPRVTAGRLVVKRSRRQSRGPARHHSVTPGPHGRPCLGAASERHPERTSWHEKARHRPSGHALPFEWQIVALGGAQRRALRGLVKPSKKKARALDGFGCPTEAPYGCFLPDLTRFGTCRHPNPSNALVARYILPAPARQSKVANLGRGFLTTF